MKKLLTILLLVLVTPVSAHGYYHNHWAAPFVVGAGVGYWASRPYYYPSYYTSPPVIIQQPVYVQQPNPALQNYHYEPILDANCNCYRAVLVPNQ